MRVLAWLPAACISALCQRAVPEWKHTAEDMLGYWVCRVLRRSAQSRCELLWHAECLLAAQMILLQIVGLASILL